MSAYQDGLTRARETVKWLAFLDLDEFLFPVQQDNLRIFLKDFEDYGGVCANWVMFGTNDVDMVQKTVFSLSLY